MKIKVLRDYSGQEGTGVDRNVDAGSVHTVTRARGSELKAVGLVEIISDEAHPDDDKEEAVPNEKSEPKPIANKAAPVASNKATKPAEKKGDSK